MCEYHCEDGWLPIDGERDEANGVPLLIPTEYTACFACNEAAFINNDLKEDLHGQEIH